MADLRQKKINPPTVDSNNEKHKRVKHGDSDYDINDVIKAKRLKREHEEAASRKRSKSKEVINDEQKDKGAVVSKKHNENNVKASEPTDMQFSRTASLSPKHVSADSVLLQILNWKANWIKECQNQKEPPPVSSEPMKHLKTSYESINEYLNYFLPPLLHETWAQLIESVNSYKDTAVHVAIMSCDLVTIEKCEFAVMTCQTAIKKRQSYPREGDLVCVDLPFIEYESDQEQSRRMKAFGYITDVNIETLSRKSVIAHNYKVPEGCNSLVKYEIRLKPRSHVLDYNALMRMMSVLYVKPTIRNFEALLSLKQSVLYEDILKPRKITCHIITPTAVKMESNEYNESQYKAILGSVEAISRPFTVPKLLMIQGPPGTGKTHTLVGMIKKIFSHFCKNTVTPKILVCAPSNGAIDEIGKRLVRERANIRDLQDRHLKIVRIGQEKNVHPEMQRYLLDTLVENNIKNNSVESKKNFEAKKKALEDRIFALDQEIANFNALKKYQEAKRCGVEMARATKELVILNAEDSKCEDSDSDLDKKRKRMKHDLLKKADVVLSTLNSCRMSVVEQICNAPRAENSFTCVIIDEASQCTEPEILMPLIYSSISKMILIGDPMQLPATVISKDAARHKFGQSLFERLYSYFGNSDESPILMLNTQYRMHSDICSFPSKQFYGNQLKTCPSLKNRKFPLHPYIVFNVISTTHNKDDPKNIFNEGEAQFVMKLLTVIGDTLNFNASVGIITPYNGQKKLFEQKISQIKPKITPQINTIDGFQGQEKDIIILSCVRAKDGDSSSIGFLNSHQRINVALTRAKFTLIICVSAQTLKNNELWDNLIKDAAERKCLVNSACTARLEQIKEHLCIK
ncbi:uncharacterized protein B4U80_08004 [Leptotrombidium deliense]|uniref:AAA+ ATPase domain-containing protein n=1 Tax=Leptotrombidium deliense TaxID=299467 RepID=A0A443SAN4_9ACAR|nr:uncharacterized protein B4U80_08004 [Leptotrombidium deliense]